MIIHCMKESLWDIRKYQHFWGHEELKYNDFIHFSTAELFHRVIGNFNLNESYVLICIDENKLTSLVKFEDFDNTGRSYPHVYGLVNNDSVIMVLPLLRDSFGNLIKNIELKDYIDK